MKNVFGLVVCVKDGVIYFLTRDGPLTYEPQFLKSNHELVGCWANLEVKDGSVICEVPFCVKPPVHTRVFKDNDQLLLLVSFS